MHISRFSHQADDIVDSVPNRKLPAEVLRHDSSMEAKVESKVLSDIIFLLYQDWKQGFYYVFIYFIFILDIKHNSARLICGPVVQ